MVKNPGNISSWFADQEGKVRLAIASDGVTETLLYRAKEEQPFKKVFENSFKTTVRPLRFLKNRSDSIYALSNINRDKLALVIIDLKAGKEVKTLYAHPDVDIDNVRFTSDGEPAYVDYDTWKPERYYFNKGIEKIHRQLRERLNGYWIRVVDRNDSTARYVIRTYADNDPGAIYIFNLKDDLVVKLADVNPSLNGKALSNMEAIQYYTKDGVQINGYLTLPSHKKRQHLPLIVIPHNGPTAKNTWGYNDEVQFFASRGFAVFQPNYRGSTGYGKKFWASGFGEWGGKIQDDIADGVRYLIEQKIADPKKVGIFGYSFGGFCALYGSNQN